MESGTIVVASVSLRKAFDINRNPLCQVLPLLQTFTPVKLPVAWQSRILLPVPVEITAVEDDHVVVDGNHMLAGQNLKFNVEVVAIREATEEELAHGHVHGAHDHHHDHDGCCGGHGHDHGHEHGGEGCCGGKGNGGCGCH